jgi:NADPH:quinone reductase-like Zn-dependent oxidoreductase
MNALEPMNSVLRPASVATSTTATMRAIVRTQYGGPEVLSLGIADRPVAADGEVLVHVHAAGASIGDHHMITGKPYVIRLALGGLLQPKHRVPGQALAGVVEAVGANVTTLRPGDAVYGDAPSGAYAEFVAVPIDRIALKPTHLSFEEAACTPWGVAALQGLRDAGGLKAGQRVLINGASGGVGTWAVQIAKALGAEVTAVCSTRNVERVRALGADTVIDYTQRDFTVGGPRFDVLFDTVGNRSIADCRSVIKPTGTFVSCSGGSSGTAWLLRLMWMLIVSLFTKQKLVSLITKPNQQDLVALRDLVDAGKAKPNVERSYPLSQVADALRHVGEGHAQGQTVIQIAPAMRVAS